MMKKCLTSAVVAFLGCTSMVRGQAGILTAVPSIGAAAPVAAPAAPANLWSFLLPTADQKAACKTCFCNSPLGQLTSGAAGPLSAISGGLMPNLCAQNSIANAIANNPSNSSEGAAARIKKDEADAKARRSAVRYLGTVDCNYWPEAVEALRLSLRKDRNECVRFEAALALRNGCCCRNEIIKALENCITGSTADGFPAERSERVRAAATEALMRCPLVPQVIDPQEPDIKIQKTDYRHYLDSSEYYRRVAQMPREQVLASARATLVSLQQGTTTSPGSSSVGDAPLAEAPPVHQRSAGLVDIFTNALASELPTSSSRPAFFSNVTRALTGKQDGVASVRTEVAITAVPVAAPQREVMTVVPTAQPPLAYDPGLFVGGTREMREDVARMLADGSYSQAEMSAAKVRLDEMQGQARRGAVRYLATVDCHYYHEAEAGLIAALRADRVETVRLEAARAMAECRGVTVRILDALNMTALGLDSDGNPGETSPAVKLAARDSLNRCLMRGIGLAPTSQPLPMIRETPAAPMPQVATPVVKQEERRRAESVSANAKVGPQAVPARSFFDFLTNRLGRDATPTNVSADAYVRQATSARMRGLTPIGTETSLAIPAPVANEAPTR